MDKEQWIALHTVLSFLFAVLAAWHLVFNWRPFVHYLKQKGANWLVWRREFGTAFGTVVLVGLISVFHLPPASYISDFGAIASSTWETPENRPVIPHAETLTIPEYAKAVGIEPEIMQSRITELGVTATADTTLQEMANQLGMSPLELSRLLGNENEPSSRLSPSTSLEGAADMTLSSFSLATGIPIHRIRQRLSYNGFTSKDSDRIRDIARTLNCTPDDLVALFQRPPRSDASLNR